MDNIEWARLAAGLDQDTRDNIAVAVTSVGNSLALAIGSADVFNVEGIRDFVDYCLELDYNTLITPHAAVSRFNDWVVYGQGTTTYLLDVEEGAPVPPQTGIALSQHIAPYQLSIGNTLVWTLLTAIQAIEYENSVNDV